MTRSLVLPDRIAIQLVDSDTIPLKLPGVLFRIHLYARYKNDFNLQPFASDGNGLVTISKEDLESEVEANYDSGLMDHARVTDCFPSVEVRLLSVDDIDRAIEGRKIWSFLLAGERRRWNSMDQLLNVYRNSSNGRLLLEHSHPIRDDWATDGTEYFYDFVVVRT